MLKFYALGLSGYCTKVRNVLRIKQIPFEELTPDGGHYSDTGFQERMPPGSIPAIEDGDFKLFDSEAIVEYLEDRWPQPSMRSDDFEIRARQRAAAQFHNTRLEPVVRGLFPLVKQSASQSVAQQVEESTTMFHTQLNKLGQVISPAPFIGGESACLADCGFPATIRMGQDIFRHLKAEVTLPEWAAPWLGALENHIVIGDETQKNRAAIRQWLEQFS